jgi:hypothetical protein
VPKGRKIQIRKIEEIFREAMKTKRIMKGLGIMTGNIKFEVMGFETVKSEMKRFSR